MKSFQQFIRSLRLRDKGATMIEYALLAAIVSIATLGTLQLLGPSLVALFQIVTAAVQAAA